MLVYFKNLMLKFKSRLKRAPQEFKNAPQSHHEHEKPLIEADKEIPSKENKIRERRLKRAPQEFKNVPQSHHEYEKLLIEADKEISDKENKIRKMENTINELESNLLKSNSKIEALEHSGSEALQQKTLDDVDISNIKNAIIRPSLKCLLELMETLYKDRITVLSTAKKSAQESSDFRDCRAAAELLFKLSSEYWEARNDGRPDTQAKDVFGKDYSAKESESISNNGKLKRTFEYKGKKIFMEKHLKHGRKDSIAETLRIHFEWIASEKRIIIGHCGKHLDF